MWDKYSFLESEKDEWDITREKIEDIEQNWGVPFYLFHENKAVKNAEALRECLGKEIQIAYAMKANPWIVKAVSEIADYIEVCSEGELEICREYHIPGSRIVADGVMKDAGLLKKLAEFQVSRISIDSKEQMEELLKIVKSHAKMQVLLRVSSGNQFGMEPDEVRECVRMCERKENIDIVGIQYYPGTQRSEARRVDRELEKLLQWIDAIEDIPGFCLREIEFGAGIGVPYFEGEDTEGYRLAMDRVADCVAKLSEKYRVIYESGRNIAATCGIYVTKVFARKIRKGKRILFCKGGSNHLRYHGGILGVRSPEVQGIGSHLCGANEECMVCGSLCNEGDVMIRSCSNLDREITVGDYLIFYGAGAYAATDSPVLFLVMEMPAVLLYNKNDVFFQGIRRCTPTYRLIDDRM